MKTALIAVILAVAACGGAAKPGSGTKPGDDSDGRDRAMSHMGGDHQMGHGGHMGEKHEGEMADMPPQLARFHDTLAPRWHAARGPQRMTDTCAAIRQFHADAEKIAAAEPPGKGDPGAWSKGGKKLTEAVVALETTCKNKDAEAFETAFERVHETFHGLMEAAGGHDEHGDHGEHGKDSKDGKDEPGEQGKDEKHEHH
jgi:hypothetical protein